MIIFYKPRTRGILVVRVRGEGEGEDEGVKEPVKALKQSILLSFWKK